MSSGSAAQGKSARQQSPTAGLRRPPTFAEEFANRPPTRPPEHKGRIVSPTEVSYIVYRFLEGAVASHIATELGVHRSTVLRSAGRLAELPSSIFEHLFTRVPIQRPQKDDSEDLVFKPQARPIWAYFCRWCGLYVWNWDKAEEHMLVEQTGVENLP